MRSIFIGLATVLFCGCAGSFGGLRTADGVPYHLLDDDTYDEVDDVVTADEIFELSESTIEKIKQDFAGRDPHESVRAWFVDYAHEMFSEFKYADKTMVAEETFKRKQGNCLSLTVLTSAIARELGIPHLFQEVLAPPTWDRQHRTILRSKHVNLLVFEPAVEDNIRGAQMYVLYNGSTVSVIDFFPASETYPSQFVMERQVVAMFYANLASKALLAGRHDEAYTLLRNSIEIDPDYGQSFNILALVYSHTENPLARDTFYHAASLEPESMSTIHNMVIWLNRWGMNKEADSWKRRLEESQKDNPFYYYDLAETSFVREDFRKAVLLYNKAIAIDEYQHEFHYGLFKAYLALQKYDRASKSLKQAIEIAEDGRVAKLYHSKMEKLTD